MKKMNIAKSLLVAAVIPTLLMAASGSASAGTGVTWKNGQTGYYLLADKAGSVWDSDLTNDQNVWSDISNSDGSWNEVNAYNAQCLTGYYRQVYTENCNYGTDGTNWWERWYEISTSTGWKLQNRETGYILDDDGHGDVYANSNDVGNSDHNQRWH
ncbi:hypothetical protein [Streptomyces sp. NBC_01431]|uniref:hypothetical protein n=1 Tax=Streptomyces sp. NBC_01431 TaxID=2903863 RepID=UPI002E34994B|nr:hypothetical protein [Streptomyces sp. NBC_01431]